MKQSRYISTIFKSLLRRQSGILRRMMSSTDKSDHLQRTAEQQRYEAIYFAQVADMYYISPTVKTMFLSVNTTASYKAGQWLDLMIPGLDKVGGFTMCTSPLLFDKTKILQLAVKYSEHPPTYWIHKQSEIGSEVAIRFGGDFVYDPKLDDSTRDVLLLGGGVGINPLYCIMNYIADLNKLKTSNQLREDKKPNTLLLYSSSKTEELLFKEQPPWCERCHTPFSVKHILIECIDLMPKRQYFYAANSMKELFEHVKIDKILAFLKANEMDELAKNNENIKCQYFVTREKPTQENIKEHRISKTDLEDAFKLIKKEKCMAYICGPIPMIEALEKLLKEMGLKKDQIFVDRWW